MPNYEYKCPGCHSTFIRYRTFEADSSKALCSCGEAAKKEFTAAPVHFKGGGWGGSK